MSLAILVVAAALRLYALSINPFHHDEGINGWFVTNLVREGRWVYDPANYHGPTLFYLALASEVLFGLTDEAMRLVPALFGIAIVALTLALRPFVGSVPALVGAGLLALSPGATYVARYFIHESLLALFTLAVVVCALYLVRTGQQRYLVLAAASLALIFATKETGIVHVAVLAIAAGVAVAYVRIRQRLDAAPDAETTARRGERRRPRSTAGPSQGFDWRAIVRADGVIWAAVVFLGVYVAFFSSFLSNPEGLADSLATFTIWTQTGTETQVQPFQQYLVWMWQGGDQPILLLGFVGGLIVAWRAGSLSAVFIGLWALGITLAYSLVSYKTPWIALNMLIPLAVLAGLGIDELGRLASRAVPVQRVRAAAGAVLAGTLALSGYQAVDLNFVHYDDGRYPYVFVHTTRDALALIAETERISALAGGDEAAGIAFMSPEYWPLPWYYRHRPQALFWARIVETEDEMIVARVDQEDDPELQQIIDGRYQRRRVYNLRPGVDLVLYVRNDIAGL